MKQAQKCLIKKYAKRMRTEKADIDIKLKKLKNVKALLFDVYGTMLLSRRQEENPWKTNINEEPFASLKKSRITNAQIAKIIDQFYLEIEKEHALNLNDNCPEVDMLEIWGRLFQGKNVDIENFALEYELRSHFTWLMPYLKKALKNLKQKNILLGIVSNSQFYTKIQLENYLNDSLENLGFPENLQFYSFEHKIAKPTKKFFRMALDELKKNYQLKPEQIAYIGNDLINDIIPAKNLGMKTILFVGDKKSLKLQQKLTGEANPDIIINNFNQLTKLF